MADEGLRRAEYIQRKADGVLMIRVVMFYERSALDAIERLLLMKMCFSSRDYLKCAAQE
jgi:hypothetical protein